MQVGIQIVSATFLSKNHTGPLRTNTTQAMSDSDTPTDGPISLQEFEKRLTGGQITKNTRVRMPNGQEWMLLPSSLRSDAVSTTQIRNLGGLRRRTASGPVWWLLKALAWLCYFPAFALVLFERFSGWLFRFPEGVAPDFTARLECALLLGLTGLLVQCGGAMLVELFDLLLAMHRSRLDRSESNKGGAVQGSKAP